MSVVVVATVAACAVPGQAAAATKRCGPKGVRTVLQTTDVRVTYKVSPSASLAIGDGGAYWRSGGEPRSAPRP
jgi:hypothetical protein